MDWNNDEILGTIYGDHIMKKERKMLGERAQDWDVFNNIYVSRFQIDVKNLTCESYCIKKIYIVYWFKN